MRLDDQQESSNVEDRRSSSGSSHIGGKSIGVWAHYTDGANRILEAVDVNKCDTLNVALI